jgi:hypothetical protein
MNLSLTYMILDTYLKSTRTKKRSIKLVIGVGIIRNLIF